MRVRADSNSANKKKKNKMRKSVINCRRNLSTGRAKHRIFADSKMDKETLDRN